MTARSLFLDVQPIRDSPAFRRLLTGTALSGLGGQLTTYAVPLQIFTITRAPIAVGAVGLAAAVPAVVCGLFSGALIDAVDRRALVLVTSSCLAVVSVLFALQAMAGASELWLLYGLVAVQALFAAVNMPAQRTFLPRLLPAGQVSAGAALTMFAMRGSVTAGPALAGVVAGLWGLKACYLIDAVSFAAALYAVARLPAMRPEHHAPAPKRHDPLSKADGPAPERHDPLSEGDGPVPEDDGRLPERHGPAAQGEGPAAEGEGPAAEGDSPAAEGKGPAAGGGRQATLSAVREGLRFIARSRVLTGALLADTSATVLGMPIALFPAINAAYFRGNPQTLGLLVAAPAFGGLLGAALSGPVRHVSRQGRAMLVAGAVWGLALTGFGLTHSLWPALALLAIAGAADTLAVVFRTTVVQLATPDRYRGRVSAAEYVVGVGCPQLGNFRAGAVGSLLSASASAVSGGMATVAGAALIGLTMPAFTRYQAGRSDPDPEPDPIPDPAGTG